MYLPSHCGEERVGAHNNGQCLLSLNQERVVLQRELARRAGKEPPTSFIFVVLRLLGALNLTALEQALHEIVHRHGALRTVIVRNTQVSNWEYSLRNFARTGIIRPGLFVQRIVPETKVEFCSHDFKRLDRVVHEKSIARLLK